MALCSDAHWVAWSAVPKVDCSVENWVAATVDWMGDLRVVLSDDLLADWMVAPKDYSKADSMVASSESNLVSRTADYSDDSMVASLEGGLADQ